MLARAYSIPMRILLAVMALVAIAATVDAGDHHPGHGRRAYDGLFLDVPLDYDTSVVFPFGGSHHAVPGVVTINQKAPYFCRVHALGFSAREPFIEHLGVKHGLTDREIPNLVLVDRHQVRYVGD